MPGTYAITEVIAQSPKFSCMVSFNNGEPQLYEVEVPNDIGSDPLLNELGEEVLDADGNVVMVKRPLPEMNAAFVASVLQQVADDQLATVSTEQVPDEIRVVDGQIVL